jgi:RNA polymerase sigma-70 factor (ECF subfamily)
MADGRRLLDDRAPANAPLPLALDRELVARLRRRDEAAYRELVGRHHASLVRLARTFVRDVAAAEEVAQETWLGVLQGIDRFEERSSLKAWIFAILANRARTRAQRDGRMTSFGTEDLPPLADASLFDARGHWKGSPVAWRPLAPDQVALSSELGAKIRAALEALPDRLRAVVLMRDVEKLAAADVCLALGVSESHQRVLLHRGRVQLRAALEPYLAGEGPC